MKSAALPKQPMETERDYQNRLRRIEIERRSNAYPKLIEALRKVTRPTEAFPGADGDAVNLSGFMIPSEVEVNEARALLRELGEVS